MAYGMLIKTTEGLIDASAMRAARLYSSQQLNSTSGSRTISGFDSNDGFVYVRSNNSALAASWSWNNSTKVFSWSPVGNTSNPSSNMTAFFMVTT